MRLTIAVLLTLSALTVTSCSPSGPAKPAADSKPKMTAPAAHSIADKDKREMFKETREDLKIVMGTRDETAPLSRALSGAALDQMSAQITEETAAGRVKIRDYDNIKLSIENVTKDIVGLALVFTDNSRVVDAATGKMLEKARGEKVKLLLAVKKIDKRWKIIEIFSQDLSKTTKS